MVEKPYATGKFRYKMKKTEFQTEDLLSGSLRAIKAHKGTAADLLVDRYDSIFRRNLMELEVPLNADKKRV